MKNKNILKMCAMILASSLSFYSIKAEAKEYDKDELLEETIENYKRYGTMPRGVPGIKKSIIPDELSFNFGTTGEYPIGLELFISDDVAVQKVDFKANKDLEKNRFELGNIVSVTGSGNEMSDGLGKESRYFENQFMAIVGIKMDKEFPYALAPIDQFGNLGNVVGWFRDSSMRSGYDMKIITVKHANVARQIIHGMQTGFFDATDSNDPCASVGDPYFSIPYDYVRLNGDEHCPYGVRVSYYIPDELKEGEGYFTCDYAPDDDYWFNISYLENLFDFNGNLEDVNILTNHDRNKAIIFNFETGLCEKYEFKEGKVEENEKELQLKYGIQNNLDINHQD